MKIVLLNVKYSPNLGDGIIAECFEAALRKVATVSDVVSCDLAGRTAYGHGINRTRQLVFSILDLFPGGLRQLVFATLMRRMIASKLSQHYADTLNDADGIAIGGGQLIADADLNFPLKISAAIAALGDQPMPIAIHGAGVGAHFGKKGLSIFKQAFGSKLTCVNVRDRRSVERWNRNFGHPEAGKVWDPGLLSSEVYGTPPRGKRARPLIGIGITNPATLTLHADSKKNVMRRQDWVDFYTGLIAFCFAEDCDVELFTNGAHDDAEFAARIAEAAKAKSDHSARLTLAKTPEVPADLALNIAKYDAIVAHRLHANIIAYSYAVPHVGLGWDSKMEGFFEETGRSPFLISKPGPQDAAKVGQAILQAMKTPIDPSGIQQVQNEVHTQISTLVETLSLSGNPVSIELSQGETVRSDAD